MANSTSRTTNLNKRMDMTKMSPSLLMATFFLSIISVLVRLGALATIVAYTALIVLFYCGQTHGFTPFWR